MDTENACNWLADNGYGQVSNCISVSGGNICRTWQLHMSDGNCYFLKTHQAPPANLFAAEAAGLRELARFHHLRTPRVLHFDLSSLILEYIEPTAPGETYWTRLGNGLARLHSERAPCFGFLLDNFCGTTRQPNPRYEDGHAFFAEQRLLYQGRIARDAGLLLEPDMREIESLCVRLGELIPAMPAVLLHGDLWSGNAFPAAGGEPVLVDPAAYWGWAEAEIAMTRLFGGFAPAFYEAYLATHPLDAQWQGRASIYNLYHLLNHLNLFGTAYLSRVREVVAAWA